MEVFRVDDMTCGHCVSSITKAVHALDAEARVEVDLARPLVGIEAASADAVRLRDAISGAGYTPVPVESTAGEARASTTGGCCGCCG